MYTIKVGKVFTRNVNDVEIPFCKKMLDFFMTIVAHVPKKISLKYQTYCELVLQGMLRVSMKYIVYTGTSLFCTSQFV